MYRPAAGRPTAASTAQPTPPPTPPRAAAAAQSWTSPQSPATFKTSTTSPASSSASSSAIYSDATCTYKSTLLTPPFSLAASRRLAPPALPAATSTSTGCGACRSRLGLRPKFLGGRFVSRSAGVCCKVRSRSWCSRGGWRRRTRSACVSGAAWPEAARLGLGSALRG